MCFERLLVITAVPWSIELSCLSAIDLPQMDGMTTEARKDPDPYVVFKYSGTRVCTNKVSNSRNPQFNELLSIPAMLPANLGPEDAVQYLSWNQVNVGVYDSDTGQDDLIATRSIEEWLGAHLQEQDPGGESYLSTGYHWITLYGAPREIALGKTVKGLFGRTEAPAKLMNKSKIEGSAYRGRILIKMDARRNSEPEKKQKGDQVLNAYDQAALMPSSRNYELRLWLLEGVTGGEDSDFHVELSCGEVRKISASVKTTNGYGAWYEEVVIELSEFPVDFEDPEAQAPDVFVNLYRGEERVSYLRVPKKRLVQIQDMRNASGLPDAGWHALKRDVFGPLGRQDFAGEVLMVVGYSDSEEAKQMPRLEKTDLRLEKTASAMQPLVEVDQWVHIDINTTQGWKLKTAHDRDWTRMDPYVRYSFYKRPKGANTALVPIPFEPGGGIHGATTIFIRNGGTNPKWNESRGFKMKIEDSDELWTAIDVFECEQDKIDGNDKMIGTRFYQLDHILTSGMARKKNLTIYTPQDQFKYNPLMPHVHNAGQRRLTYKANFLGDVEKRGKIGLTLTPNVYEVAKSRSGGGATAGVAHQLRLGSTSPWHSSGRKRTSTLYAFMCTRAKSCLLQMYPAVRIRMSLSLSVTLMS